MTTDQERISTTKFNIRQALKEAGVDVPVSKRLDEYPPYITALGGMELETVEVTVGGDINLGIWGAIVDDYTFETYTFSGFAPYDAYGDPLIINVIKDGVIVIEDDLTGLDVTVTGDVHRGGSGAYSALPTYAFVAEGAGTITVNTPPPQDPGSGEINY